MDIKGTGEAKVDEDRDYLTVHNDRVKELEYELQTTRESHQSTIEELESTNEELKSTNEELQSSNEELQSTNEEMESSKEELQNEELRDAHEKLSGLHRKYEDLYEFAPCGYATVSPKGMITSVNLNGAVILGTTRSKLKYFNFGQFLNPVSDALFSGTLKAAVETGVKQSVELVI